jgi:hypothetical protein
MGLSTRSCHLVDPARQEPGRRWTRSPEGRRGQRRGVLQHPELLTLLWPAIDADLNKRGVKGRTRIPSIWRCFLWTELLRY